MKTFISLIACSLAAFLIASAAVAPPTSTASGEYIISTSKSTNLACDYIRLTGQKLVLDDKFTNWFLSFGVEAYKTNGTATIISRSTLRLDMNELKTLLNAGNPRNALKTQALLSMGLIEKP